MRILYTLDSQNFGGMEKHVEDLIKGFSARGHEVHVWNREGVLSSIYLQAGAKFYTKNIFLDIDPVYILGLIRFVKKEKIDLIHAHELRASVNAMFAGFVSRTPVVTNIHTPLSQWQIPKAVRTFYAYAYSVLVRMFSSCEVAVSESVRNIKIHEGFGLPDAKIRAVLNGIDVSTVKSDRFSKQKGKEFLLSNFSIPTEAFVFGNLSRLSAEKGHAVFLEAIKKLLSYKNIHPEAVKFVIAGGGPLEDEIRQYIVNNKLDNTVFVSGRFPEEQKSNFYNSFDCFVFPSLAEGYGIVLAEALAHGLPVICSDLDVLREVGGSSVFSYFESGNSEDLADKLYNLFLKRDNLANVSENSAKRIHELYSIDKFIDNYEHLYSSIVAKSL